MKGVACFSVAIFFVALGAVGSTYLWQAKMLHYTWQAELGEARAKGRLTEDEYIAQSQERSYMKALMSPSKVWKID
ncbi:MAG: hypothetical protein ACE5NW_10785 [Acidiferrobacterales bacterium]